MKKTVFKITGKFKDALNAIKWFRKYFGNKTMREMRLTFKFIPESKNNI